MRSIYRWRRLDPVLIVTLTLLCAACLVVYQQRRALIALDEQSTAVLEKVLARTAGDVALAIRASIEEAAYDTLRILTRADLLDGGLERVVHTYNDVAGKYPHIDRFFVWSEATEARAPGEVLFFDPTRAAAVLSGDAAVPASANKETPDKLNVWDAFRRDPVLGARIHRGIVASSTTKRNYAAREYRLDDCTYDTVAHYYWREPQRDRYFFVLGFVVCAERAGKRLIPELYAGQLADWFKRGEGGSALALHVFDDQHRLIFGSADFAPAIAGTVSFPVQFYPPRLSSVESDGPGEWTVRVSTAAPVPASMRTESQWLLALSVLLIIVALWVAVRGQKRVSELATMQTEFVAHVSHQLRTPLSLLTTVTDTLMLDRVKSPEKLAQYIDVIRTETRRLSTLVERILEFSRVEGRRRVYQFESVDLVPLVRESAAAFLQKPAAQGFSIPVVIDGESLTVQADPAALEQALVNLLDNAVKYSDQIREVAVRVHRSNGDAVVEVADRGIGIAPAEHSRIFERFYRGPGTGQRSGFGLGLAIVKEIVTAHRGRVEVESAPGRGSVFRLRIPVPASAGAFRYPFRGRTARPSDAPEATTVGQA